MNTGIPQGLNLISGHAQNVVVVGKLFLLIPEWLQRPRIMSNLGTHIFFLFYFVFWWQVSDYSDESALVIMFLSDQNSEYILVCCSTLVKKFPITLIQDGQTQGRIIVAFLPSFMGPVLISNHTEESLTPGLWITINKRISGLQWCSYIFSYTKCQKHSKWYLRLQRVTFYKLWPMGRVVLWIGLGSLGSKWSRGCQHSFGAGSWFSPTWLSNVPEYMSWQRPWQCYFQVESQENCWFNSFAHVRIGWSEVIYKIYI